MTTSVKNNFLPPSLISNLQQVLIRRNNGVGEEEQSKSKESSNGNSSSNEAVVEKPVILVTNGEGIESPGLTLLVEALVRDSRFNVHVCAPHLSVPSYFKSPVLFLFHHYMKFYVLFDVL